MSGVPEEKLPKDFGKYRLVRRIATGGMAEIFLAFERKKPAEPLVIKRILPNLSQSKEFVSMFLDEARIAANLKHENIVEIYDVGRVDGAFFIAMEYVHGEDIRRIYNRAYKLQRSLPLSHSIRVIAEAGIGLGYAHRLPDLTGKPMGVVHRDVSPQNILVTYDGGVKVVDFGIAKAARKVNETRAGVLKGKYSYMSPEQAMGESIDHRTDIFALGIILYETTTGTRLFKKHNELATLQAIMKCQFAPPSEALTGYPVELEQVVLRALAKEADERYQTGEELAEDLYRFLEHSGLYVEAETIAEFMKDLFGEEMPEDPRGVPQEAPVDEAPVATPMSADETKSVQVSESAVMAQVASVLPEIFGATPGFVDDADLSEADGTVAENPDDLAEAAPRDAQSFTRQDRGPRVQSGDEIQTLATQRAYRDPAARADTAIAPDGPVGTDRIRARRGPRTDVRRTGPTTVRGGPSSNPKPPARPAVLLGLAAIVVGLVLLGAVAVDRLFRDPPPIPPEPLVEVVPPAPSPDPAPEGSGQVTILTEPGAVIAAGDARLGKANERGVAGPFNLPAGQHVVRVALASTGFERIRAVTVRENGLHEFEIQARQGRIKFAVAPWARVSIGGREVGITPLSDQSVPEGAHHVVLENPDIKRRWDGIVRVEATKVSEVKIDLNAVGERM